jgi:hypothetical protein
MALHIKSKPYISIYIYIYYLNGWCFNSTDPTLKKNDRIVGMECSGGIYSNQNHRQ